MDWQDRRQTDRDWRYRRKTGTGGTEDRQGLAGQRTDRDWQDRRQTGTGGTEDRQGLAGQKTDRGRDRRQTWGGTEDRQGLVGQKTDRDWWDRQGLAGQSHRGTETDRAETQDRRQWADKSDLPVVDMLLRRERRHQVVGSSHDEHQRRDVCPKVNDHTDGHRPSIKRSNTSSGV